MLDIAKNDRGSRARRDELEVVLRSAIVAYRNCGRKINGHDASVMEDALNDWEVA